MAEKTLKEIKDEFYSLHKVYQEMVGDLYPNIAVAKLIDLRNKYLELGGDPNDLIIESRFNLF